MMVNVTSFYHSENERWMQASHSSWWRSLKKTFVLLELKWCIITKNLKRGKELHTQTFESGDNSCVFVATALVQLYADCGNMKDAHEVFDTIKDRDVVCWTALILGYAENGEGSMALDLFNKMRSQGVVPDSVTFIAALKACSSLALKNDTIVRAECLEMGRQIHSMTRRQANLRVQNTLIEMYGKCGSMVDARLVFDGINCPDVVSWNTIILGYADNGQGSIALELFSRMRSEGFKPDSITFMAVLKSCSSLGLLELGRQIHTEIGARLNVYIQCTLIDMYAACRSMVDARQVFNGIKKPDVVSWNAIILGYAENGEGVIALDLYVEMKSQGFAPNAITFVAGLKACGVLGALEFGKKIHADIDTVNSILGTCLVDFYAKCGSLKDAQLVFDLHPTTRNVTTWNALLTGYSRLGDTNAVFELFENMQGAGFQPDSVTFTCIFSCCSHAGLVDKGKDMFEAMPIKHGITPTVDHYTCIIDILGRFNKLEDALGLLRNMSCRPDPVTWMAVLGACYKWKNMRVGRMAFQSVMSLGDMNPTAYVLMAQIYGSCGMWEEREMVLQMRAKLKDMKANGESCWTSAKGDVHKFLYSKS